MNRYRQCREAAGMSQKYVAVTLGIAGPSVSNWESGKTKPSSENLMQMADLYGVSVDYLLGRTDIPNIYEAMGKETVPRPDTLAAHQTEAMESVSPQRMEEIITQAYHLIMANKKQP